MHAFKHFKTITYHKWLVLKGCFAVGLYRQGLCHDLSKYMPSEFFVGVKYFQGDRSPNNAEREDIGYSSAWLHHKGRNKHHYEYWLDYSTRNVKGGMAPAPMPVKYIVEMLMDRIAACKVYQKDKYTAGSALVYYLSGKDPAPLHEKTRMLLEFLLRYMDKYGEKQTYRFVKKELLPRRKEFDDIHNLDGVRAFCEKNL
ncbi:MAG: catalase [Lachnospiraceae bacterium]|nr:catalase [Lachnospiraceae bacterium]